MKTNFQMVREIKTWFPKETGIISNDEVKFIKETFCIKERSVLDLRNLRDFVVVLLNQWCDQIDFNTNRKEFAKHYDRISAITMVIDTELVRRGEEV